MTVSLDARQSLAEIEHALFKSFPFAPASITHVTSSDGVVESIFADVERGQA